tara:strand:- start:278 stop:727 length:450 start_codon:yes stop_codon:yes gene_type:complete
MSIDGTNSALKKRVVVVLPKLKNKILMQLRDERSDIDQPGRWGFFGGQIDRFERPNNAVKRELFEELCIKPYRLKFISREYLIDLKGIYIYAYTFDFSPFKKKIKLNEGMGMQLISFKDLKYGRIKKLNKSYKIVKTYFIKKMFRYAKS